jgi:hypothetical protein
MTNDEIRRNTKIRITNPAIAHPNALRHSGFGFLSSFVICHLSFDNRFMVPMHGIKAGMALHESSFVLGSDGLVSRTRTTTSTRTNRFIRPVHVMVRCLAGKRKGQGDTSR